MIKKQDKTPDDLSAGLSEIIAEIIRHLPGNEHARIIGYTILSPPSLPPVAFRVIGDDDRYRLSCETIECDDAVFITARLPPGTRNPPHVRIIQGRVRILMEERAAVVTIQSPVDIAQSHYSVRNGILDITLIKRKK